METVADCLASVRAQAGVAVDHVVVDGASSDGTREILEGQREDFGAFVSERDGGIYEALNKGITLSGGAVVGFLHADDLFADSQVLARIQVAFADPSVQGVYGDLCYVSKEDTSKLVRYWRAGEYTPARLRRGWMPPHPTLYVRREWYERIGSFNTGYRIAADYDFILRLFSHPEFKAAYIPEVLVTMRVGGASNRSLRNVARKSREDYRALRANGVGGLGTLTWKNVSKLGQFLPNRRN